MDVKKILYIDMDGVVADFDRRVKSLAPWLEIKAGPNWEKRSAQVSELIRSNPSIFLELEPIEGAIVAVNELFESHDVFFLSTPPWNEPESWAGKRYWLEKWFGDKAFKRLILSHRKDLNAGDYLIDDNPHNGASNFKGKFIHFGTETFPNWEVVLKYLKNDN